MFTHDDYKNGLFGFAAGEKKGLKGFAALGEIVLVGNNCCCCGWCPDAVGGTGENT